MEKKSKRVAFTFNESSLGSLENMTDYEPPVGRIIAHPWIRVAERLPEAKGSTIKTSRLVLIVQGGSVGVGHLVVTAERQYWFDNILRRDVDVTHWQPLPLLPGEGE